MVKIPSMLVKSEPAWLCPVEISLKTRTYFIEILIEQPKKACTCPAFSSFGSFSLELPFLDKMKKECFDLELV